MNCVGNLAAGGVNVRKSFVLQHGTCTGVSVWWRGGRAEWEQRDRLHKVVHGRRIMGAVRAGCMGVVHGRHSTVERSGRLHRGGTVHERTSVN